MITLFAQDYDSESLYDLCRDISESIDPDYNKKAKDITPESSVAVSFIYIFEDGSKKSLLDATYYFEDLTDIEDNAFNSLDKVQDQKDVHGFHSGTFKLTITLD
jgi:hypothetical protein